MVPFAGALRLLAIVMFLGRPWPPDSRRHPTLMAGPRSQEAHGSSRPAVARLAAALDQGLGDGHGVPWWVTAVVVGASCLVVLFSSHPALIVAATTPTNNDLGGHVWTVAQLFHRVLPSLTAWSPEWFGGLPVYLFYPVVPALLVAVLHLVVPYGIALKLVVIVPSILLPAAVWGMGRLGNLKEPLPLLLSVGVLLFFFDDTYTAYGGTLLSAVAGEFSEALGLPLMLVGLGLLDRALRERRGRSVTAVVLALACLCHPVVAVLTVVGVVCLTLAHFLVAPWRATLARLWPIAVLVPVLGAFWFVPFLWYRGELSNSVPYKIVGPLWSFLFDLPGWTEVLVVLFALIGAATVIRRRLPLGIMLVGLAAATGLGILVLSTHWFGSGAQGHTFSWLEGRLQPCWSLFLVLLAGLGAGVVIVVVAQWWRWMYVAAPLGVSALVLVALGINCGWLPGSQLTPEPGQSTIVQQNSWLGLLTVETNAYPAMAAMSFGGYERNANWPAYAAVMSTLRSVGQRDGCGRMLNEEDPASTYGSSFEMTLAPYWTDGCITSVLGANPIEDSWTGPFAYQVQEELSSYPSHFQDVTNPTLDLRHGVGALQRLGVRYYMAFSPRAVAEASRDPRLTLLASASRWNIYLVSDSNLVSPLRQAPVVVPRNVSSAFASWNRVSAPWLLAGAGAQPAAGGPASWPRSSEPAMRGPGQPLPSVQISHVVTTRTSTSFVVSRTGIPVEVKDTYFPWWRVAGAEGPWRIAPNFMVIVPTATHVEMTVGPAAIDAVAAWVSGFGLVGVAALAAFDWNARRRSEREALAAATSENS